MSRGVAQRRIEHRRQFAPSAQPLGHVKRIPHVALEAEVEGADAAQRQIHIIRSGELAKAFIGFLEARPGFEIAGDDAHHGVGMADEILRRRLDRDIATMGEGLEIVAGAPGVVDHGNGTLGMGGGGDGGNVLHLHGLGAGTLAIDDASVGADKIGDAGADQGIVIGRLDAEALEQRVAELAGRMIDAVDHQEMIARLEKGEEGRRDRRHARGTDLGVVAALEGGDRRFDSARGGCAAPAIDVGLVAVFENLRRRKQHGRGMIDGGIDEAMLGEFPAGGDKAGLGRKLRRVGLGFCHERACDLVASG